MSLPILYIKQGCPWCNDAIAYFKQNSVAVEVRNILTSPSDKARMLQISGQSLTPTLEYGDFMVADFSVDEFKAALAARPDIQQKLGLSA